MQQPSALFLDEIRSVCLVSTVARIPTIQGHCWVARSSLGDCDGTGTRCLTCSVVYSRTFLMGGFLLETRVEARRSACWNPAVKERESQSCQRSFSTGAPFRPGSKDRIPGHPFGFTGLEWNLIQGQTSSSQEVWKRLALHETNHGGLFG